MAKELDSNMHNYVRDGRHHTYAVFSSFNDLIAGAIGAVKDQLEANVKEESPPQAPEPISQTPALPDIASTMLRLEQRLNKTAAEVADLIQQIEQTRQRSVSQSL